MTPANEVDEEIGRARRRVYEARVRLARHDPAAFCALVLRDESTGKPIKLAPYHAEWHELTERHRRVVFASHYDAGKTQQLSIGRTLFRLGRNPRRRIGIGSITDGPGSTSTKIATAIRRYIEEPGPIHDVFPELRPGDPWRDDAFSVKRPGVQKDYSVESIGLHGHFQGARFDDLTLDDMQDELNTATEHQRKFVLKRIQADFIGRLEPSADSSVVLMGQLFHPQDTMHQFAAKKGWVFKRYGIFDEQGNSRWPEKWTPEAIDQARIDMGPIEFPRKMLCQVRADDTARFKEEWLQTAFARGNGKDLTYALRVTPNGYFVYCGVDLGVQEKAGADLTVLTVIIVHPDGTREILWIESGRWFGPEILRRMADIERRFQCIFEVENNAGQDYLLQFNREYSALPARAFTTGRNKAHPEFGIEGLATEFSNGKWIIPNKAGVFHPEVQELVNGILSFTPKEHTSDHLMSLWLARESARKGQPAVAEQGSLGLRRR